MSGVTVPFADVTAVILAGGQSSRMGSNKALLPIRGGRIIEVIYRHLSELFAEVLLVTNHPEQYDFLSCRKVPDRFTGMGALAGLHAGLYHALTPHIFTVACDMPYLDRNLIRRLVALRDQADVVIPVGGHGLEPLHALYATSCLPFMEQSLLADRRRIVSFFPQVRVAQVSCQAPASGGPGCDSFRNINTPADYYHLREESSHKCLIKMDPVSVSDTVFPIDIHFQTAHK